MEEASPVRARRGLIVLLSVLAISLAGCDRLFGIQEIVVTANDDAHRPDDTPTAADLDGDGVRDADDNCPMVANADQRDFDGDSFGDACDNCPLDPNAGQEDGDQDRVGNDCDPHSTAGGDCLVLLDTFNDPSQLLANWFVYGASTSGLPLAGTPGRATLTPDIGSSVGMVAKVSGALLTGEMNVEIRGSATIVSVGDAAFAVTLAQSTTSGVACGPDVQTPGSAYVHLESLEAHQIASNLLSASAVGATRIALTADQLPTAVCDVALLSNRANAMTTFGQQPPNTGGTGAIAVSTPFTLNGIALYKKIANTAQCDPPTRR